MTQFKDVKVNASTI